MYIDFPSDEKIEYTSIVVSKIRRFELISNPSEYWINLIEKSRLKTRTQMEEDGKKGLYWEDYMEPA